MNTLWASWTGFKTMQSNAIEFHIMRMSRIMAKPTIWHVRLAKTQIRPGIRPVGSESSLSVWRSIGALTTHLAHSEDLSDWADAQADLSLRWAHMSFCWFCHEAAHIKRERNINTKNCIKYIEAFRICQSDYEQVYILMALYVVLVNSFCCVFLVNIFSLLFVCLY